MWTSDNIELLTKLWSCGHSAGEIAAKLGCSRSAACAKLQRLGLRRARKPPTSKPMILRGRSLASDAVERPRPAPARHVGRQQATDQVKRTHRELREMLAQAVKNTG
jgi:GcrA cell cycle regulator